MADALGIAPGTPTADRQYDDWYTAYKGSAKSGSNSSSKTSSAGAKAENTEDKKTQLTDKELSELMAITGYAPSSEGSTSKTTGEYAITNKHTDSWVAIGNARYTNRELLELVLSGDVKEIRDPVKMTVTYVRA